MHIVAVLADGATATWLDPILLALIAGSVLLGVRRGLIRSVAGFGGLILGALFAGRLAALIDPSLDHAHIQHPPVGGAVAFIVAYIAILAAVEMGARALKLVSSLLLLGWIDRLGGALFGLLRGVLISMLLLAGVAMLGSRQFNATLKEAGVAVFLWQNLSGLGGMLPQGMQDSVIKLVNDQAPFAQQAKP